MAAQSPGSTKATPSSLELPLFPEEDGAALSVAESAEELANVKTLPESDETVPTPCLQESASTAAAESLPELPKELHHTARAMEKVFHDPAQLPGAFAAFCSAAYVKPEWAGVAGEYLAALFEENQDCLAEMTRVPDLIIELGSGHYTLTFMVAARWAAKADLARLTRLAEALIATQSKMNCAEVTDLMLALTTSLAISRFSRAEQLLTAAETHTTEEMSDALQEARLWLDAGRIVRASPQEARDLWDQRLRRPRAAWSWTSREECNALAELAESLEPDSAAAALFRPVVPACWWALLETRVRERIRFEAELAVARSAGGSEEMERFRPEPVAETGQDMPRPIIRREVIVWKGVPFFVGGLVGAFALLVGLYIVRPAQEGRTLIPGPQTTATHRDEDRPPEPQEHPNGIWRKQQTASLAAESPDLRPWVEKIELGEWAQFEALLKGEDPALPKDDPRYQKLLLWLHLDPPADRDIRTQVPRLLAALRQDSTVIELWEKLVYPGSLNAAAIQEAALRTLHDNQESWSPTQRALLSRIATVDVDVP